MGGKLGYKLAEGVTASLLSLPSDSEVNSVRLAVTPEVGLPELTDHLSGDDFIPHFNQINEKSN